MSEVRAIATPSLAGKRRAFVLAEDRIGHYPEFRGFFIRTFDLDRGRPARARLPRRAVGDRIRARFPGPQRRALPGGGRDPCSRPGAGAARRGGGRSRSLGDPALDDRRRGRRLDVGRPGSDRPAVPDPRREGLTRDRGRVLPRRSRRYRASCGRAVRRAGFRRRLAQITAKHSNRDKGSPQTFPFTRDL